MSLVSPVVSIWCGPKLVFETQRTVPARFGSPLVSDEEKLALVLARYPDDAAAVRPISRMVEMLGDDAETRELLRLIAEGEAATIAWLRAYHGGLGRRRPLRV